MNTFCLECVGHDIDQARECDDHNCPFYPERRADMEWQIERRSQREEVREG